MKSEVFKRTGSLLGSLSHLPSLPLQPPHTLLLPLGSHGGATPFLKTLIGDFRVTYVRICLLFLGLMLAQLACCQNDDYITIQTSDGENVTCVIRQYQPAFKHDLLQNHKLQEFPSEIPKMLETSKEGKWHTLEAHVSTANCPRGTIPVRDYRVYPRPAKPVTNNYSQHEYGIVTTKTSSKLYGAKASINVWKPTIEDKDEMSISQIWITSGNYATNDLNTIEIGWQVDPEAYKDNKSRLFLFWTSDVYRNGCYNLECPGFIQTSRNIVLGGAITPVSSLEGNQFEISILVWKDREIGNCWLSLGPNNTLVGYWPSEIFTNLADYAELVEWGGEILNLQSLGRHTGTQMGSGHFPDEGFGNASYFRNLEIVDYNNNLQPIQDLKKKVTNSKYYNVKDMQTEEWSTFFFYGGPGFRPGHSGAVSLVFGLFIFQLSSYFLVLSLCFH